jgi:hypothetical protein
MVGILAGCTSSSQPNGQSSASDLTQYDGRILKVSSSDGKVTGQVGIKVTAVSGKSRLTASYNLLINQAFAVNKSTANGSDYQYIGDLVKPDSLGDAEGSVSAIYCNKDVSTTEPFTISYSHNNNCPAFNAGGATGTFAWQFQPNFASYAELLAATQADIYSGAGAWEQDPDDASVTTMNDDLAVSQGNKVASFTLMYTE